ncbi:hypothetical protein DFH08DRAFT_884586, partial [Mycena albidolilacea]
MPPMVLSVSSLPAPVPVRTSPTSGGKPRSSAREKRRNPVKELFPFSLSSTSSASATQTTTICLRLVHRPCSASMAMSAHRPRGEPTPYWRRSGRGRGKESRWAGSGSGDHHVACYRHVCHDAPSAFPVSSSVSVSEYLYCLYGLSSSLYQVVLVFISVVLLYSLQGLVEF